MNYREKFKIKPGNCVKPDKTADARLNYYVSDLRIFLG
jgi:hypothetical protein